jgi:dihydroorotase-like cyclic amidohydrolase
MHRLLQYAAMLGLVVVTHAEDEGLAGQAAATASEMATRLGLPSAPADAEALAVARDITLAEMTGARLHLRQVTTGAALALVRAAKTRGVAVTAGVTPAHFMLSDLALQDFRTFARLSPPLREEADRQAVLAAIGDGTIDVIASGHDPRGPEDKRLPFADAAPGMAGAETLLARRAQSRAAARRRRRRTARRRRGRSRAGRPREAVGGRFGEDGRERGQHSVRPATGAGPGGRPVEGRQAGRRIDPTKNPSRLGRGLPVSPLQALN